MTEAIERFVREVRMASARMTVEEAVKEVMGASGTVDGLVASMRDHGYCPTLRVNPEPMGVREGRHNHAIRLLRRFVVEAGFCYFDGSRVHGTEPAN